MNNRVISLEGANKIFSVINVKIEKSNLGFYYASYKGESLENKTLTGLCQDLILKISSATTK